jgi:hypothetical protein
LPLILPLPAMTDQDGNPLAKLPSYQSPQVVSGPSVLGNVNDPTSPNLTSPARATNVDYPTNSILGSVGIPSRASLSSTSADNDVQAAKDKLAADSPKPYDYHAHGVLGNIGHIAARVGNIAGDFLDPAATSLIPHSDLYNARVLAGDQANLQQQKENQQTAGRELDSVNNEQATRDAEQARFDAGAPGRAAELAKLNRPTNEFELWQQQNPNGTPSDYHKAMIAPQSQEASVRRTQQWAPALKKLGLPEDLFSSPGMSEADAADAEKQLKTQLTDANNTDRIAAATTRAAQSSANLGTWSLQTQKNPDGTEKTVLLNSKTGATKDAPPGLVKAGVKPSADEQKRADLSGNLLENLDQLEDIIKRRPELFGPAAGRYTAVRGYFGSSDPDVAALSNIKHQLGIVAQSSHGMRSAQGIEGSANALTNNFYNTPEALEGAIKSARNSANVFIHQADHPGESRAPGAAPSTYSTTASGPGGHQIGSNDGGKTWFDTKTGAPIK